MKYFKEFEMPKAPKIPEREFDIRNFGAAEGGEHINTQAFKKAISACSEKGGGKIIVPKGKWLTGAIHIESNTELCIEKDAELVFSEDKKDYLPVVFTSFEGIRCYNYSPLIYACGKENVAITGEGTVNGGGMGWWGWKIIDDGINSLYTASMLDTPVEKRIYGEERFGLRPCFLQLADCKNVLMEGIKIINSPFWNVHPIWCENVIIRGLRLDNPFKSPNTDSINIEGCNRVLVENCLITGGGDDIFTLKSGRGTDGWNMKKPCKNIVIRNCEARDTNGGGIVIGSEMSGGVENILAENCRFKNIMNGLKIKSKKGRGGYIKNIEYKNIKAENVINAINVTLRYAYDDQFSGNGLEAMPEVKNLHYENFECLNAKNSVTVEGVEGCKISNVSFKNIKIENGGTPFCADCIENLSAENVCINI